MEKSGQFWEKAKVFLLGVLAAFSLLFIMGFEGGAGRYQVAAAGTSSAVYAFVTDTTTGRVSLVDGDGEIVWTRDSARRD